jgi:hypothetical protein
LPIFSKKALLENGKEEKCLAIFYVTVPAKDEYNNWLHKSLPSVVSDGFIY